MQITFPTSQGVSLLKMRALIGKKWAPKNRNGDIWEHPDEARHNELLYSDESSLPVEAAAPPHLRRLTLRCLSKL